MTNSDITSTPSRENAIGNLTPTTPSKDSANHTGNVHSDAQVKRPNIMSKYLFQYVPVPPREEEESITYQSYWITGTHKCRKNCHFENQRGKETERKQRERKVKIRTIK